MLLCHTFKFLIVQLELQLNLKKLPYNPDKLDQHSIVPFMFLTALTQSDSSSNMEGIFISP